MLFIQKKFICETNIFKIRLIVINFSIASSLDISASIGNFIASLDFNPNGETVATIDKDGACLISDMSTDNCSCYLKITSNAGK